MAAFELAELYGTSAEMQTDDSGYSRLSIRLNDFRGINSFGNLPDDVGTNAPEDLRPVQIFYALILLIIHNQAATVNSDPEQQLFITESAKSLVTGVRDGQVKRTFTVNFFSDEGLAGTTGVDYV